MADTSICHHHKESKGIPVQLILHLDKNICSRNQPEFFKCLISGPPELQLLIGWNVHVPRLVRVEILGLCQDSTFWTSVLTWHILSLGEKRDSMILPSGSLILSLVSVKMGVSNNCFSSFRVLLSKDGPSVNS